MCYFRCKAEVIPVIVYFRKAMLLKRQHTLWRGSGLAMPKCAMWACFLTFTLIHTHAQTCTNCHMVTHMHAT